MTTPWFRLSLDIDHDGNIRGASYEVRSDDRLVKLTVMPEPGPFGSIEGLMHDMVSDLRSDYGMQLRLL